MAQQHVALEQGTVWLSQAQMGQLFDTNPENVLMHLQNIFKDEELGEPVTTKEFLVVRQEGKRQVRRRIKHYNLDAIISVQPVTRLSLTSIVIDSVCYGLRSRLKCP